MDTTENYGAVEQAEDTVGKRLEYLRKQHGYRQEDVAEKMSVTRQAVSDWEHGKSMPELETMRKLCEFYEVTEDYLLGSEKEKPTFLTETVEERAEKWKKDVKLRKTLLQLALAAVLVSSVAIPPMGLILCISTFFFSRKWKVDTAWLNFVIVVCLLANVYGIYVILNHTVFDFGYSTVTPIEVE